MSGVSENHSLEMEKKNKKLMIVGGIVIILLLFIIILLLMRRQQEEEPKRNVVVTKKNAEEVLDEMLNKEYVEPGYYSASMNTVWHFAKGDAVSEDAYVANDVENVNDVYFDVVLADNEEEVILKSPVIPRGSELENIALDTELSAGTYDCVMIYHLVDEGQNTVGTLRVGLTIIIEK